MDKAHYYFVLPSPPPDWWVAFQEIDCLPFVLNPELQDRSICQFSRTFFLDLIRYLNNKSSPYKLVERFLHLIVTGFPIVPL